MPREPQAGVPSPNLLGADCVLEEARLHSELKNEKQSDEEQVERVNSVCAFSGWNSKYKGPGIRVRLW